MMTFDELSEAVYENLDGQIVAVSSVATKCNIVFECADWQDQDRRRKFELVFDGVAEATVTPTSCGSFHIADDHPLLWQHNDEIVSMFFASASPEPWALLGRLYEAHAALFSGWRELSAYWRADSDLLRAGYGRLAQGPRRAIDAYARVVGGTLRYSIVQGHTPRVGYRVVVFDESYVVCRSVSVIEHALAACPGQWKQCGDGATPGASCRP